jgi:hypothetical protein
MPWSNCRNSPGSSILKIEGRKAYITDEGRMLLVLPLSTDNTFKRNLCLVLGKSVGPDMATKRLAEALHSFAAPSASHVGAERYGL